MLRQSWKHSLTGLGVLLFIAIGGILYYLNANKVRQEPIKIYRVTELPKKETHSDALPAIENDADRPSNDQRGAKTADTSGATPTSTPSNNVDPNSTLGEATQQESDLKKSEQNDKGFTNEEIQAKILHAKELQARQQETRARLQEYRNLLEASKKRNEARRYALAERLNSLSAAEQRVYFEEYRSQYPAAKEFIRTTFFEKARAEAASQGYSEQMMEVILKPIEQTVMGKTGEEWVQAHIKELRKYGFEPKF